MKTKTLAIILIASESLGLLTLVAGIYLALPALTSLADAVQKGCFP